ncbi:hypothetical protein ASE00_13470 [Sphingomonas sp. Root710]|uniref:aromatic ring-hydroxylating oxygenase subunit alpha n=1 Tax=Sphingomonas sp. Root710 TaxID=1736594 RepID=UPI0006FF20A2|nr:aromatic ring-hydroxylating dioxygenase subunit alpha [Sphingomonas sp. Root710]KRB82994.1 hypothetical protein ASE00_13470 [Sphingomonas sp. Root710]
MSIEEDIARLYAQIRPDFVPAQAYHDPAFVAREKAMLWPHSWLMACREEEVAEAGQSVVFDIADDSILIVRASDGVLRAFYNVCPHRGRRLKDGNGNIGDNIACRFHGWRWNARGENQFVLDRENWNQTGGLCAADVDLGQVRVDTWDGWVFVTLDSDAEPLESYLDPLPDVFAHFDYRNTRIAWHKTLVVACNWKVVLEAFIESYHVAMTHPQSLKFGVRTPGSQAFGRHSYFFYPFVRPKDAEPGLTIDYRQARYTYVEEMHRTLGALQGRHAMAAAERLMAELPETATFDEVNAAYMRFHADAMAADGARYPAALTPQDIARAGTAWNIFPNMVILPTVDGLQAYRARPNGDDPSSAIFDVWWLERSAPDAPSSFIHEYFPDMESFAGQCFFLEQDFDNIKAVQDGVKSRGFRGVRPNPHQEVTVQSFEKTYYEYLLWPRGEGADT